MGRDYSKLECDWASVGAAFSVPKSSLRPEVDPEHVVCDILSAIPSNPRYAPIFVIWIGRFGKMLDAHRLHEMLSSMPPESAILYQALIDPDVGNGEIQGLSERAQAIVRRAHDPRLLPLAKSKVKRFDHVVSFNIYFSSRYDGIKLDDPRAVESAKKLLLACFEHGFPPALGQEPDPLRLSVYRSAYELILAELPEGEERRRFEFFGSMSGIVPPAAALLVP